MSDGEFGCPVCERGFETERGMKIHCGQAHSKDDSPFQVQCECEECGDVFFIKLSYHKNGQGKFCSTECKKDYNTVDCVCDGCGEEFEVYRSDYENGVGKYCSRGCSDLGRRDRVSVTCEVCDETFDVRGLEYERRNVRFCSLECRDEEFFDSSPGIRKTSEYKNWRDGVKKRDDYTCQDCGDEGKLHAHHITPIHEDENMATDLENGVTVCPDCHSKRHEKRGEGHLTQLIKGTHIN